MKLKSNKLKSRELSHRLLVSNAAFFNGFDSSVAPLWMPMQIE